ncbi:MAG: ADP-forming succinate--CoA ligase subunit beta [Deltaproteobacteria bacterium HGW-Deltaproteobacteria-14]|jgi:succinyl-CoA synthetase beta subunit|nr:MAG: ADP-forming succinate--CoA ligase subunit beta [Deltaproteobacteria bacterium HGW-Deltaproteobacteria-14]
MNIHEHQAKALLKQFAIPVPEGRVAFSVEEARAAADSLGGPIWVVKAQIHAGGRGKAGGVKLAKSKPEVETLAKQMLGMKLVTKQTGPEGKIVNRIYIEEGVDIARELYLGMVVDRATAGITIMLSSEGGTEIEEVAATNPDAIIKIHVSPAVGVQPFQLREAGVRLGLSTKLVRNLTKFVTSLAEAFVAMDCSLLEINPLVVTSAEQVIALDAKINFDSNALYRHPNIADLRDLSEEEPSEVAASSHDLSYIKLDGTIGCLVNGAGLAMATMDILKFFGGEPANFLDVGGSATVEKVTEAFRILMADKVHAIFVNIFGGIMKCDTIATGLVEAARTLNLNVPLVVRLEGTNVDLGKQILRDSGLEIISADSMADGAEKAVAAATKA